MTIATETRVLWQNGTDETATLRVLAQNGDCRDWRIQWRPGDDDAELCVEPDAWRGITDAIVPGDDDADAGSITGVISIVLGSLLEERAAFI